MTRRPPSPRRLARLHVWLLVGYFLLGTASQKLMPGGHEVFPFFGWSLFSRVATDSTTFRLLIVRFRGAPVEPAVALLEAPPELVGGDRAIARKLIQRLGDAWRDGDDRRVRRLRRLLERNYLRGPAEYELIVERYDPLERWHGAPPDRETLASFASGRGGGAP